MEQNEEFGRERGGLEICPTCLNIHFKKKWHHPGDAGAASLKNNRTSLKVCPACAMIKRHTFEGELWIRDVPERLKQDLRNLIVAYGERATQKDPQDRIINIENQPGGYRVTTTENQLAVKLGKKIKDVFRSVGLKINHTREPAEVSRVNLRFNKKIGVLMIASLVIAGGVFAHSSREIMMEPSLAANIIQEPAETAIEKKVFGYSTKGKPIEGYEIGSGTNVIFMFGSIHGNEMGTTDLLNKLVDTIKEKPELVARNKKLIIIPIANPDGYYDRTDKLNANGVNLNVNFDTAEWKRFNPDGYYAGPKPFSEIESQVLKKVAEDYYPSMMISYHARGALVSPEAGEESISLAKWYAHKTGYQYYDEWNYFGTATRWFTDSKGHPSITVELSSYLASDWEINKKALLELIGADSGLALSHYSQE